MAKKYFMVIGVLLIFLTGISGQNYNIGHTTHLFFDSDRNREIETEIYYPSEISGDNVAVSEGVFPVIVFGHGFLMKWEAYEKYWTELVPNAYVICFPTTEMGINTNHERFGNDLKFVARQMQDLNEDSSSLFFGSIAQKTALMGHSMGGGASFLAAKNNNDIHTLINFAAAETDPSSISAAAEILVPALIFSGEDDCVTPPESHQDLMYDSLASNCKTQIYIKNGGHCFFAANNFNCNIGESFCGFSTELSREEQQSVTFDFLKIWLKYTLNDHQGSFAVFNDSLQNSERIKYIQKCNITDVQSLKEVQGASLFPNPFIDQLQIEITPENQGGLLKIFNLSGNCVYENQIRNNNFRIDLSGLPKGTYNARYVKGTFSYSVSLVKS